MYNNNELIGNKFVRAFNFKGVTQRCEIAKNLHMTLRSIKNFKTQEDYKQVSQEYWTLTFTFF